MSAAFCEQCGASIDPSAKFCRSCGAKLGGAPADDAASTPAPAEPTSAPAAEASTPEPAESTSAPAAEASTPEPAESTPAASPPAPSDPTPTAAEPAADAAEPEPARVEPTAAAAPVAGAAAATAGPRVPKAAWVVLGVLVLAVGAGTVLALKGFDTAPLEKAAKAAATNAALGKDTNVSSYDFKLGGDVPEAWETKGSNASVSNVTITDHNATAATARAVVSAKLTLEPSYGDEPVQGMPSDGVSVTAPVTVKLLKQADGWEALTVANNGPVKFKTALGAQPDAASTKEAGELAGRALEALYTVKGHSGSLRGDALAADYAKRQKDFYLVGRDPQAEVQSTSSSGSPGIFVTRRYVSNTALDAARPEARSCFFQDLDISAANVTATPTAAEAEKGESLFQHVVVAGVVPVTLAHVSCYDKNFKKKFSSKRTQVRYRAELVRSRFAADSTWRIGRLSVKDQANSAQDVFDQQSLYRSETPPPGWFTDLPSDS